MEKIGIVTDQAVDLPSEIIQENQLAIVPVKLSWPEIENLPGENTFQKMREMAKRGIESFGKTSQPSLKDFLDKYNEQFTRFDKIICLTLTSKLSGTNNSANQAVKFLPPDKQSKVSVIDTLSVSGGQALLVLRALALISQGREFTDIVAELKTLVANVNFYIMFDDPKWIEASGRVSHLLAGLMKGMAKIGIRPVLAIKEGVITQAGLQGGVKDVVAGLFKQLTEDIDRAGGRNKKIKTVITHGDDLESAERLKKMIESEFDNIEVVFINLIDDVVGAVAGPKSLTLGWLVD
jgi:DegV family protein with EDD domain